MIMAIWKLFNQELKRQVLPIGKNKQTKKNFQNL